MSLMYMTQGSQGFHVLSKVNIIIVKQKTIKLLPALLLVFQPLSSYSQDMDNILGVSPAIIYH